jgi:hypothetical protein
MITKSIPILFLLTVISAQASEMVLDVSAIAGKSKQQVAAIIGKPSTCSSGKYGEKCLYRNSATEIVFIKGKADWITIEGLNRVPYSSGAITALGLKATRPTFENSFTIRWESVQGLLEVSVFPAGSVVDYAYVKVRTK